MTENKIRITTAAFYKFITLFTLGLMLASCDPIATAIENNPAVRQTEEITLETGLETDIESPTPEATATPEPSPTPETAEVPDDIDWTGDLVVKENLIHPGIYGPYDPIKIPIKIRPQDVHKDEPFTLLNGKYYVQVWADAWFREGFQEEPFGPIEEGPIYHITVPIVVYDLEEDQSWKMQVPVISKFNGSPTIDIKRQAYTGPFEESYLAETMDDILCFAADGNRTCGFGDNYSVKLGPVPQEPITEWAYKGNIQDNVEFWRELMEGVYTKETIEEFERTLDLSLLSLDSEPNAPKDFVVPLRADP